MDVLSALRLFELDPCVADVLEPVLAILAQSPAEKPANRVGRVGWQPGPIRLRFQDFRQHLADRAAGKGGVSGEHLDNTHPNAHTSDLRSTSFPFACSGLM